MSEYEKTAKRIADAIRNRDDGMVIVDRQFEQLEHDIEDAIAAAVAAERAKWTTPNMFWTEDCDGDNAVDDPTEIADNLDIGCVFSLLCARSLPTAYFVAGIDERGCTTATPATDEQIAEYKAAKKAERDRRQAEFDRRNAASGVVRAVPIPTAKEQR